MPNANQPPKESSIDFPELLARVDNDRELLLDLMSIFKEDFPRHVRELSDVIAAHDIKKMTVVSHTIKGMLANLDKGASQRPNPLNPALRADPPPQRSWPLRSVAVRSRAPHGRSP